MAIYKYVKPERIDIFTNSMIRFTQPVYFNDPFEMKPHIHSFASEKIVNKLSKMLTHNRDELQKLIEDGIDLRLDEAEPLELIKGIGLDLFQYLSWLNPHNSVDDILNLVEKQLPELTVEGNIDRNAVKNFYTTAIFHLIDSDPQNSLNFTQYLSSHLTEMFNVINPSVSTNLQHYFNYQVGVLSLSKTSPVGKDDDGKNIVMWAHYTVSHKGFVLEFDESHSFFDQRLNDHDTMRHLHPVEYSIERPNITLFDTDTGELDNHQLTDHFIINFFYTKSVAWKYEEEVRMLLPIEDGKKIVTNEGDIHLFSFPPECLKGVYLGYRVQPETRQKIIRILNNDSRYSHLILYQATPDEQKFMLNGQMLDRE